MRYLIVILFFVLIFSTVIAHEEEIQVHEEEKDLPLNIITIASIISIAFVIIALLYKKPSNKIKWFLFLGIIIPVIIATVYAAYFTINLNLRSEHKGPVHWHADFEIWNCNDKIDLIDPTGLTNRIGSPVFHEHGDDRIHVEGVVLNKEDVNLHRFFEFVGGDLNKEHMKVLTNYGKIEAKNNDECNGKKGKLQVFVYKVINPENNKKWIFKQEKIEDFTEYVLSPYGNVPPGDCIIIEFSEEKTETKHLCETYKIAMQKGELSGS